MEDDASMSASCARCDSPMVAVPLGEATAYGCIRCAAVFLTHTHAARVRAGIDRAAPAIAERAAQYQPYLQQAHDTLPLRCPVCRVAMQCEWQHRERIRLDQCPSHGVFFDAHELIAVAPPDDTWRLKPGHRQIPLGETVVDFISQILSN